MDARASMLEHSMNIEQGLVMLNGITVETPVTSEHFVILVRTVGNVFEFCKATGVINERGIVSGSRKLLSENRCISDLRRLGSDRNEFIDWNEKLINAIAQVRGWNVRRYIKEINSMMDVDRNSIPKEVYTEKARNHGITDVEELS